VRAFLEDKVEYNHFLDRVGALIEELLPSYIKEGKTYLTVAVGCTGGKHRSVAVAERLGQRLDAAGYAPRIAHRDIGKE
jgi:UPF0042 nucleotide-binding protein